LIRRQVGFSDNPFLPIAKLRHGEERAPRNCLKRLVGLVHFGGGLSKRGEYYVPSEDQDDSFALVPFLALLWWPREYCHQKVQSELAPHLLMPRRLYDSPQVNRLLERLAEKLSEIYPDSFLLSVNPKLHRYHNHAYRWWQVSLPHFVNLALRILSLDLEDLIEADSCLTVSAQKAWKRIQRPTQSMNTGNAAYEYDALRRMEWEMGESFFVLANAKLRRGGLPTLSAAHCWADR
jgi:hypothetical protein